jgi:hypothetical protein
VFARSYFFLLGEELAFFTDGFDSAFGCPCDFPLALFAPVAELATTSLTRTLSLAMTSGAVTHRRSLFVTVRSRACSTCSAESRKPWISCRILVIPAAFVDRTTTSGAIFQVLG